MIFYAGKSALIFWLHKAELNPQTIVRIRMLLHWNNNDTIMMITLEKKKNQYNILYLL